jgi:CubicO group peptidase (beta-lactamase class C family)
VGALVGIALGEGKITSLDQPIGELLKARAPEPADARVASVSVRQLLSMTSGIAADDAVARGEPSVSEEMRASADWVRHVLGRRLVNEPGTRFAYSDAGAHLLSAIVADTSGQSTFAYARAKLFQPLGIGTEGALEPTLRTNIDADTVNAYERSSVAWPVDPQGYHYGAALLRLPARDLAKFGYLYLNGGQWDGRQVVPADYVRTATSAAGASPNASYGYGWLWWVGAEGGRTFIARGHGGQLIYVVPEKDLVVVVTCDPEAGGLDPKILISQTILPAVH